ncbi:MAG: hypothetical protein KI790_04415 [Cyclobacteriaceae bacterium]|nr:hypothetical protein [Cyclobacteriaceae bacterium HetDA_MAG_MS6]
MDKKTKDIADSLLSQVDKIDMLAIAESDGTGLNIVSGKGFLKEQSLSDLSKGLPIEVDEFFMMLKGNGMLLIKRLETGRLILVASQSRIVGLVLAFFSRPNASSTTPKSAPVPKEAKSPSSESIKTKKEAKKAREAPKKTSKPKKSEVAGNSSSAGTISSEEESVLRIQKQFLRKNNVSKYFKKSVTLYSPLKMVGGDFFWIRQKNDHVYLALADCHMTGASGALLSMHLNTFLEDYDYKDNFDFTDFNTKVNKKINTYNLEFAESDEDPDQISVSMGLAVINQKKETLNIFSSGIGCIFSNGVGLTSEVNIDCRTAALENLTFSARDRIFMFTDGYLGNHPDNFFTLSEEIKQDPEKPFTSIDGMGFDNSCKSDDTTFIGIEF